MLILQSYKCRECGHLFIHKTGGFILQISAPKCPKCGSKNVEKMKDPE